MTLEFRINRYKMIMMFEDGNVSKLPNSFVYLATILIFNYLALCKGDIMYKVGLHSIALLRRFPKGERN